MYILGISCYYHDSAAAILKDGMLIAAADEERFSRIKHDKSFPKKAIDFCLKKANITSKDLSYVVFYEKPFLKFERIFLNSINYAPKTLNFFKESMKKWFFDDLWIKSKILSELQLHPKKLFFCQHHLSHAASSFFCSPFKKSAILTIDAVGEWMTTSWGIAEGNNITLKEEIRFPHSLGLLYSTFTDFTGFEVNEGEYKMMGLAPFGKPRYVNEISKLVNVCEDGSYSINLDYFSYQYSLKGSYSNKFEQLFGKKNLNPEKVIPYFADIAASIQFFTEEILIKIAKNIKKQTKQNNLCYGGGVALNSSANWRIYQESGFKDIFIQPSAGDSGGALGAALWFNHTVLNKKRVFVLDHAYWGACEDEEQISSFLNEENIKFEKAKSENDLIDKITDKLVKGQVVGWMQGRFEWGPRALGNRSILADPRSKKMKDRVNRKIKFRESFRPFAPSVIKEKAQNYFLINDVDQDPLKYMLYVVPVKEGKRSELSATTHVDGTARLQVVEKQVNPRYHKLIKAFGEKTGTHVLLNTSFNLKGEPIVDTVRQGYSTFQRSGLDVLVCGDFMINKK